MLWKMRQNSFSGGRLDKELMGRQDLAAYFKGTSELKNFVVRRQGGISKRRGTNLACDLSSLGNISGCRLIPIVYSKDNGYYILLHKAPGESAWYMALLSKDGVRLTGGGWSRTFSTATAYRVATGINATECGETVDMNDIDYFQSGDTIFLVNQLFRPRKIVFSRANLTLTIDPIAFNETHYTSPPIHPTPTGSGFPSSGSKRTIRYVVTYKDADGFESPVSATVSFTHRLPWSAGASVVLKFVEPSGVTPTGNYSFCVYKKESTEFGFIGQSGVDERVASSVTIGSVTYDHYYTFTDDYITPDLTMTTIDNKAVFNRQGEYPSTVALYQQRLVLCGTRNNPFTIYMSTSGDIFNFNVHSTIREDDSLSVTLPATEMPEINHVVMSRDLIVFTNGGEWEVAPVSGNTISYKTISSKMQSAIGSYRRTKPIMIGDEIVFVDGSGENLLATRYNFASDGYESKDLTIMSKWIFNNNSISRICYKRTPDSSIVCILGNGEIAELAYMKEHEVCAWSRQTLAGGRLAKDCATSKAISNGTTEVMILSADASSMNWEALVVRDDVPVRLNPQISDHVCMDACRTQTSASSFTVPSGYTAVNTSTGYVYGSTSAAPAGTYIIGQTFESRIVTIYPEPQGNDTIQMEIKNATEVEVRVVDSSSFRIGANATQSHLRSVTIDPTFSSGVITLKDADVKLPITGVNTRDGRLIVLHDAPFQFNLTSLNATYQVEMSNLNSSGGNNG